ncbi:hypothetical protein [Mesorhizobium sp. WSM3862]|uniref:hypothetical protein n=1 Tax=Mesorhizobium sp. WSM3862 TaxID=632858 RepID=UPI000BB0071B|nr:hypothetical protein [Mesorhizobium sp. WSM3862]PBB96428.1 hypothetical protein CK224_19075 [Mesorhizobium sp. WSM3862]
MFAKEGFTPLSILRGRIPPRVSEALLRDTIDLLFFAAWGRARNFDLLLRLSPASVHENAFLKTFYDNAYAVSPRGEVMSIDMRSIVETFRLGGVLAHDVSKRSGDVPEDLKKSYRLCGATFKEIDEVFRSSRTGINHPTSKGVFADIFSQFRLCTTFLNMPVFFERGGMTICFDAYDYGRSLDLPSSVGVAGLVKMLRPFEGWSLCTTDVFVKEEWPERLKSAVAGIEIGEENRKVGRPADKVMDTAKAYAELYPAGHGEEAWLKVLRRVNEKTGRSVSVDTLKRAVTLKGNGKRTD